MKMDPELYPYFLKECDTIGIEYNQDKQIYLKG